MQISESTLVVFSSYLEIAHILFCVLRIHAGSGKESTTVLLTIRASGVFLPLYIIYKSKCLYDTWCPRNIIKGAVFKRTDSG